MNCNALKLLIFLSVTFGIAVTTRPYRIDEPLSDPIFSTVGGPELTPVLLIPNRLNLKPNPLYLVLRPAHIASRTGRSLKSTLARHCSRLFEK